MNETLLCLLVVAFAFVITPMILPVFVLMAQRKGITDSPNFRKFQQRPVSVLGGIVIASVISITMACAHMFVDMNDLFLAMTMILTLLMIGLVDDAIDVHFLVKLFVQVFVVALLFFSGHYRIVTLGGLFGISALNTTVSCIISIFVGVFIINAINFIDGIDGLASLFGVFFGLVMGIWSLNHGIISHAVLSFAYVGALLNFFLFNAFSKKYKMYMGDSGSLILGLYAYLSVCLVFSQEPQGYFYTCNYHISFAIAWLAVPVFDMVRVCFYRVIKGNSPFAADRTHLHHLLTDWGISDVAVSILLVLMNVLVLAVWFVTASTGMGALKQAFIVAAVALLVVWSPALYVNYLLKKKNDRYEKMRMRFLRNQAMNQQLHNSITRMIDNMPVLFKNKR